MVAMQAAARKRPKLEPLAISCTEQDLDPNLSLRTVPLEIRLFSPTQEKRRRRLRTAARRRATPIRF